MTPPLAASIAAVPYSRIRELAEIAMTMPGVLKLYFGESNQPTPDFIKQAAIRALAQKFLDKTSRQVDEDISCPFNEGLRQESN